MEVLANSIGYAAEGNGWDKLPPEIYDKIFTDQFQKDVASFSLVSKQFLEMTEFFWKGRAKLLDVVNVEGKFRSALSKKVSSLKILYEELIPQFQSLPAFTWASFNYSESAEEKYVKIDEGFVATRQLRKIGFISLQKLCDVAKTLSGHYIVNHHLAPYLGIAFDLVDEGSIDEALNLLNTDKIERIGTLLERIMQRYINLNNPKAAFDLLKNYAILFNSYNGLPDNLISASPIKFLRRRDIEYSQKLDIPTQFLLDYCKKVEDYDMLEYLIDNFKINDKKGNIFNFLQLSWNKNMIDRFKIVFEKHDQFLMSSQLSILEMNTLIFWLVNLGRQDEARKRIELFQPNSDRPKLLEWLETVLKAI